MIGKTLNHFKVLDRLLINETLTRKYFAGEDAIGKQRIIHRKDDFGSLPGQVRFLYPDFLPYGKKSGYNCSGSVGYVMIFTCPDAQAKKANTYKKSFWAALRKDVSK